MADTWSDTWDDVWGDSGGGPGGPTTTTLPPILTVRQYSEPATVTSLVPEFFVTASNPNELTVTGVES